MKHKQANTRNSNDFLSIKKHSNPSLFLRKMLETEKYISIIGAHSGISAKIAEESGFDGVWASSFEISTSFCVPDANVLSFKESYEVVKAMKDATNIPIIVDCDTGYGNAMNMIRTVEEYERLGAAGICVEDNLFPKRCSFYDSKARAIEDIDIFSKKIRAAKDAQTSKDFFVIARTEAFIVGLDLNAALTRAHAYEDAGADAILIHSKSQDHKQVETFARNWNSKTPLVVVPTKFPNVSASELADMGFKIIIFANHAMRASIKAMQTALTRLRLSGIQTDILGDIVPLSEIYRLIGLDNFNEKEKKYL